MSQNIVKAFAPATVGNIGCGYDILGMAVEEPGDIVTVEKINQPGVEIKEIQGDQGRLPTAAVKNTAGVAALEFLKEFDISEGVGLTLEKNMPMGSGLGSSAASAAATLKAMAELFEKNASEQQLLQIGLKTESTACGSEHADNIAPSLFGGIVLVRSNQDGDVVLLNVPAKLHCILVHPHIEIRTEDARKILPKTIGLGKAVKQWGNIAGLISGFYKEDYDLIGRSLQDWVIEPVRSKLIPGFQQVKDAALANGALGCSISGSGPTMFALADSREIADNISRAMQSAFLDHDLNSNIWISPVNQTGAKII
jgi:homoserine kinase